jgi:hypothetical protein
LLLVLSLVLSTKNGQWYTQAMTKRRWRNDRQSEHEWSNQIERGQTARVREKHAQEAQSGNEVRSS